LDSSSISNGLIPYESEGWENPSKIESVARPLALLWHPRREDDAEDKFIIATDEFKLKEYNVDSKQCRKTTLAPTFGGPPVALVPLRKYVASISTSTNDSSVGAGGVGGDESGVLGEVEYYAYATYSKVIGVGALPLTGDPAKVCSNQQDRSIHHQTMTTFLTVGSEKFT
jgi:hypothetical protein